MIIIGNESGLNFRIRKPLEGPYIEVDIWFKDVHLTPIDNVAYLPQFLHSMRSELEELKEKSINPDGFFLYFGATTDDCSSRIKLEGDTAIVTFEVEEGVIHPMKCSASDLINLYSETIEALEKHNNASHKLVATLLGDKGHSAASRWPLSVFAALCFSMARCLMNSPKILVAMRTSVVLAFVFTLAHVISFYLPHVYAQVTVIDSGSPKVIEIVEFGIIETFRQKLLPWLSFYIAVISAIICLSYGIKINRNSKQQRLLSFSLFLVVVSWFSIPTLIA
ncbi:hypothetical protein EZV61_19310 [Corallincola luteus]|uniref:Uncharacterized protein n=1 Tax=Corallincola luteus TaxID=1775177 RepID=A0ABY2AH40_9GAMM|nr:hypothetical protein [Corallincola luteus]TCI01076.1 hypothetical protein EZV61_19310 [Corallincola luteus]